MNDTTSLLTERLLPILIHIQANLGGDLSLDNLAGQAGLSPFHFHRAFKEAVGETTKQYTQRLRLEQAAYQLKVRDTPITDVAFELGYRSHETFTRAFQRQFGQTPRQFRRQQGRRSWPTLADAAEPETLNRFTDQYQLSKTAVHHIVALPVIFIRQYGPYTAVDPAAYDELTDWAAAHGLFDGTNLLIGVGHDDPGITPADKVRFDACLTVPEATAADGRIGYQLLPAGLYAVTTYVGPYGQVLEQAHFEIFQRLMALPRYDIVGLPALEIYRTTRLKPDYALNHTDIYIPVNRKGV